MGKVRETGYWVLKHPTEEKWYDARKKPEFAWTSDLQEASFISDYWKEQGRPHNDPWVTPFPEGRWCVAWVTVKS